MALGAGDTTVLRLTSAYAMLDDGGQRLLPSLVDSVQDRTGHILYQKGAAGCGDCYVSTRMQPVPSNGTPYRAAGPPGGTSPDAQFAPDALVYQPTRPNALVGPIADSQIVSMMQGVVKQGTGIKVAAVGKPLAGKTGTTSNFFDGWFVGFSPDLAAGVYVGFDEPRTLGNGEAGGLVAAPIFRDFMAAALEHAPSVPFPLPAGADFVTVNSITGQPAGSGSRDAIVEAFRPGTAPPAAGPGADEMAGDGDIDPGAASGSDTDTAQQTVTPQGIPASAAPGVGTGGLY
jgi:penicillin-binding protein 1A